MAKISTFTENWITFFETSYRDHLFVKILLFECTNRKIPPPPGEKFIRWEKWSQWPKIDFSDMEFWLLSENRIFRPWILRITITKYSLPETTLKTACNDLLVLIFLTFMIDIINYWIFWQKLHLFSDICFCMDIMMGMVRKDNLTTYFGSTWSRATTRIADTSTERACQSKWWHERMETKRYFLNHFQHSRFASGYDQHRLIITDVNKENKHRVVPKLMITVPKGDKRSNQRKLICHLTNYWTRLTGWIIIRPKIALAVKIRNQECCKRKGRPKPLPKERQSNCGTVASLLKAVVFIRAIIT